MHDQTPSSEAYGTQQPQSSADTHGTFVPLPASIITHEEAIQAARELARRETAAAARRDAIAAERRRAKRKETNLMRSRRHVEERDAAHYAAHVEETRELQLEFQRLADEWELRIESAAYLPQHTQQEEGPQQPSDQNSCAPPSPGHGDGEPRQAN